MRVNFPLSIVFCKKADSERKKDNLEYRTARKKPTYGWAGKPPDNLYS